MSTVGSTDVYPLFTLHVELLLEILHYLDHLSLLKCAETCTTLRNLIQMTTSLQCKIQLGALGLEAFCTTLSPMALNERLRERGRRWDSLDWSSFSILRLPGSSISYGFAGGVFAQSDGFYISYQWLPTSTSNGRSINHKTIIPLRDFTLDPSQDLLIILEQNDIYEPSNHANTLLLHIRTIATHFPHEEAVSPRLAFAILPGNTPHGNGVVGAALFIMGDLLSVNLHIGTWGYTTRRAVIFNWKTGNTIYDSDESPLYHGLNGFQLLTENIFIMISHDAAGSLHIYSFNDSTGPDQGMSPRAPKLLYTLELPILSAGSSITYSTIYRDAYVALPVPSDDQPFKTLFKESLMVLSLSYSLVPSLGGPGMYQYTLIVPINTLLRYAKETVMDDVLESTPAGRWYEWEHWGPHSTRFLHSCVPFGWLGFTSGQRIVLSNSTSEPHAQPLQIMDFSRHPTPKMATDEITILHIGRDAPARIVQPSPFEEDVVTYLPYYRLTRPSQEPCTVLLLDEHRILGVTVEDDGQASATRLHVYTF